MGNSRVALVVGAVVLVLATAGANAVSGASAGGVASGGASSGNAPVGAAGGSGLANHTPVSTGTTWSPGDYFTVTVTYRVDASVVATPGRPGETTRWAASLENGELVLDGRVSLGSVSSDFTETFDLPVGSERAFSVPHTAGAVKIPVTVTAEMRNVEVTAGPAETNVSRLSFEREGTQPFAVTYAEDASPGDRVAVADVAVVPTLELGLREDVPVVGPGEIARRDVGAPAFSPTVGADTRVAGGGSDRADGDGGLPVVPITLAGVALAVALGVYVLRKQ